MKKKYSNSLDSVMIKYRDRANNVNIIGKEDILDMFKNKEDDSKTKNKFRIFK